MKNCKRILSCLLTVSLLVGLIPVGSKTVHAAVLHTQQEAVAWANSQINQSLDYDGQYGAQCVDLIKYYYDYFGAAEYATGNADAYITNTLPGGWERVYSDYQPGDVAVWLTNHNCNTCNTTSYGHVGIIVSVEGSMFSAVNQNFAEQPNCTLNKFNQSALACAIRPDYSGTGVSGSGNESTASGYTYSLDEDRNAVITGCGSKASSLIIPSEIDGYRVIAIANEAFKDEISVTSVVLPDTITSIGASAFSGCSALKSVTLPKSLKTMGHDVFKNDSALSEITIPKSFERCDLNIYDKNQGGPFTGCTSLKTVLFEEGTEKVGHNLFHSCDGLEDIQLPSTITSIEWHAFDNCKNLKKVILPQSIKMIGSWAFTNCTSLKEVNLPSGLETLCNDAFSYCTSLDSILIPKSISKVEYDNGFHVQAGPFAHCSNLGTIRFEDGITNIVGNLFSDCDGLKSIEIPSTVQTISQKAFSNCENLSSVEWNTGVTLIEGGAFSGDTAIKVMELPDTVTRIGYEAFKDCANLVSLKLPKGLKVMEANVFQNCGIINIEIPKSLEKCETNDFASYEGGPFFGCDSLRNVSFEAGTEQVAEKLFLKCNGIRKIELPNSITSIGYRAFESCENLEEVKISTGVLSIPDKAFYRCLSLDNVVLPYHVQDIGGNAFANCTNLKKITIPRRTDKIAETAFSKSDRAVICGVSGTYAEIYANKNSIPFQAIEKKATDISLSSLHSDVKRGDTLKAYISILPIDCTSDIVWSSSDEKIAYVSDNGMITALNPGKVTITAATKDATNIMGNLTITVVESSLPTPVIPIVSASPAPIVTSTPSATPMPSASTTPIPSATPTSSVAPPADAVPTPGLVPDDGQNPSPTPDDQQPSASKEPEEQPSINQPANTPKPVTAVKVQKPKRAVFKKIMPLGTRKIKVSWKKVSKADGYEIQYATNRSFKKNKKRTAYYTLSITIRKLTYKKKYYFRVRAFRKANGRKIYGKWSAVKGCKVR